MESFFEELKHQVQCSLCNETMIEPKLLQCFHTFCKPCIKRHAQLDGQVNICMFKCPQCTSQTLLHDLNDVEDLQLSPVHSRILQALSFVENQKVCSVSASHSQALWRCLDCENSLCGDCLSCHSKFTKNHKVVSLSDLKKEDIEVILKRESSCQAHADQDVELCCQDCDTLVCLLCLKDHHINHKMMSLQDFILVQKDFLSKNLQTIKELSSNEEAKKRQEEIALDIKRDGEKAKEQVKNATKTLIKAITDHERKLLNQIHKSITKADRNLRIIRHTTAAEEYINNVANTGTASDMVDNQEIDSTTKFIYNPFPTDTNHVIFFDPNEELCKQANLGLGVVHSTPQADRHTQDREATNEAMHHVTKENTSEDSKPGIDLDRVNRGDYIKSDLVNALNVGSKVFSGIAVNAANSKIAVADYSLHCVRVFSMEGDVLLTYGSQGSGQGQLNGPEGLAFLNETDLVIADKYNHRMCIVNTTTGELVKTFGGPGIGKGQFQKPCGVHVDEESNIIVCDLINGLIQVFTENGDYRYTCNLPQNYCNCICRPFSVVTHNGLLYSSITYRVQNSYNCSCENPSRHVGVHVYEMKADQWYKSPTFNQLIYMYKTGFSEEMAYTDCCLNSVTGLAIDGHNLLVCNQGSTCNSEKSVEKFTLDGYYVGKIGRLRHSPRYLAVLNNGDILCTTFGGGVVFY